MPPPFTENDFAGLLDDAAVFPPGNSSIHAAIAAHIERRESGRSTMIGPLVLGLQHVPLLSPTLDRLIDLQDVLAATPLLVSVVVPDLVGMQSAADLVDGDARCRMVSIEIPVTGPSKVESLLGQVGSLSGRDPVLYVEPGWDSVVDSIGLLSGSNARLKLRTGGMSESAFPDPMAVSRAIATATGTGVPFKATAGLHNAVRHRDPVTGFEHHGFLNILVAVAAAAGTEGDPLACLLERDGRTLAGRLSGLGRDGLMEVRQWFVSFGTCDVVEPQRDLARLGLLPSEAGAE